MLLRVEQPQDAGVDRRRDGNKFSLTIAACLGEEYETYAAVARIVAADDQAGGFKPVYAPAHGVARQAEAISDLCLWQSILFPQAMKNGPCGDVQALRAQALGKIVADSVSDDIDQVPRERCCRLGNDSLARNDFFGPMAVAIMGGLIVATALTLLFLPALYAMWFRVRAVPTP